MSRSLRLSVGLATIGIALYPVAMLVYVFAARLTYPMDLEWCEGGMLLHTHHLLRGEPIYGPDDAVFAPFPYPPGYPALVAILGIFGLDYWTGRLVSIAFFAVFCAVVFQEVWRQSARALTGAALGAAAVATVVLGFPTVGGWYDLARVDSAFMGLSALGAWLVSGDKYTPRRMLITAVVLTMAVYTKQTAALFAVWVVLFAFVRDRRSGALLAVATFVLCALLLGLLQWSTEGQFWRWIYSHLSEHQVRTYFYFKGLKIIHGFAPFAVLLPIGFTLLALKRGLSRRTVLWTGMLVCAMPVSLLPYAKHGGYINNLMAVVMLVGPAAALLVTDLLRLADRFGLAIEAGVVVLLGLLVWRNPITPSDYVPSQGMRDRARMLNQTVAELEGGVLSPQLPFIPVRNGHDTPQWHVMGYEDLTWGQRQHNVLRSVERADAEWLLLSENADWPQSRELRKLYRRIRKLPPQRLMTGVSVPLDELLQRVDGTQRSPAAGAGSLPP